jgi:hypothetical protein
VFKRAVSRSAPGFNPEATPDFNPPASEYEVLNDQVHCASNLFCTASHALDSKESAFLSVFTS